MNSRGRRIFQESQEREWHPLDNRPAPDYVPESWTPQHVEKRLLEAVRTVHKLREPVGPKRLQGQSLPYVHTREDIQGWAEEWRDRKWGDWRGQKLHLTARELDRMDEALQWPLRFLQPYHEPAAMLALWLRCRTTKADLSRALALARIPPSRSRRQRQFALRVISDGLRKEGMVVR